MGSFDIDTNPPGSPTSSNDPKDNKAPFDPIDISDDTDSGADDTLTNNLKPSSPSQENQD